MIPWQSLFIIPPLVYPNDSSLPPVSVITAYLLVATIRYFVQQRMKAFGGAPEPLAEGT